MSLQKQRMPNKALQRTAAPLCSRTVRENVSATVAADRAFPAAVAELDRCHQNKNSHLYENATLHRNGRAATRRRGMHIRQFLTE